VTLNFPNPVRTFDAGRSCVSFWGSDASLEIAFQIEIDALRKLSVATGDGEAQLLATFDAHRDTILNVAAAAYSRRKASYHRITAAEISARG
jgi:hypothetical protein